jgi:hypothetical protein
MGEPLRRIVVLTHVFTGATAAALEQLAAARDRLGLELFMPAAELAKHPQAIGLGYTLVDDSACGRWTCAWFSAATAPSCVLCEGFWTARCRPWESTTGTSASWPPFLTTTGGGPRGNT